MVILVEHYALMNKV